VLEVARIKPDPPMVRKYFILLINIILLKLVMGQV